MSDREAIERLRATNSDAEALVQMFETSGITDDGTAAGRLRSVLAATESRIVPGLQTGITFHDSGFNIEFADPHPSSDNQVGHFLTAVGLSFNPAKVAESFVGRPLRNWLGADPSMSNEEVAIRLCVGHEKAADPGPGTAILGFIIGAGVPLPGTAPAGAAGAVLMQFRAQFAAATDGDVTVFKSAEMALGTGQRLNLVAAKSVLLGISVDKTLQ